MPLLPVVPLVLAFDQCLTSIRNGSQRMALEKRPDLLLPLRRHTYCGRKLSEHHWVGSVSVLRSHRRHGRPHFWSKTASLLVSRYAPFRLQKTLDAFCDTY